MSAKKCLQCVRPLTLLFLLSCVFIVQVGAVEVSQPNLPNATFNLRDFGAVGNGTVDDGPALQNALNALAAAGGGTLIVPAGRYAIVTPASKDFTGLAQSVIIQGVESSTLVPPPTSSGMVLTRGLDLVSEFYPRTGAQRSALNIKGLQSLLIKDIAFVGTPNVNTDAFVTLDLDGIEDAVVRHCEFYGLSSQAPGGAIVFSHASRLTIEQSVFLGCVANSGIYTSVIQNYYWKAITVSEAVFADYGQRPELFGKTGVAAPFSWINVGDAAPADHKYPRREVAINSVFLDEGAVNGLSSMPNRYLHPSAPIDLFYVTGLFMNVSNLGTSGHYLSDLKALLIESSHYGWSHNAGYAVNIVNVGNAILDRLECVEDANRIGANAATGKVTVINSIYEDLVSQAQITKVIDEPENDAVEYVRRRFTEMLGRTPDPAGHFYWSDRLLQCNGDAQCETAKRAELTAYLESNPQSHFAIAGRVVDENGAGKQGVTVALGGSQTVSTQTDADGRYSFSNLPTSGGYTVTATQRHNTITPAAFQIITPAGDQVLQSIAILHRHAIRGVVLNSTGGLVAGVTLQLSGSQSATVVTGADGFYAFENLPAGGNYVVRPSRLSYVFNPTTKVLDDLAATELFNFVGTFVPTQPTVEFASTSITAAEGAGVIQIAVTRTGDTTGETTIRYSVVDGTAQQGDDVNTVIGELTFAPGQSSKVITILVTDDAFVEGAENLRVNLSNPDGGLLGSQDSLTITITDNDSSETIPNPIDNAHFFVRQHYSDFLNREPDDAGLNFWANQIIACGDNADCLLSKRQHVSAAFFFAIEFQETGFLVHRLYRSAYGRMPRRVEEFLFDTRLIGENLVVGTPNWESILERNKVDFLTQFVERPEFLQRYPLSLTPQQFVEALNVNTGSSLTPAEVAAAVAEFQGAANISNTIARQRAMRRVAENGRFSERETTTAFVQMQYFGYLQRNPNDAPDTNLDGFNFWLNKLNEFNGNYEAAEMVRAFIESIEYRTRFGR